MGKYNLGTSTCEVYGIDKNNIYIDDNNMRTTIKDMEKQLDVIKGSLMKISSLLNKSVNQKYVKSSRINVFKGWSRTSKTQSVAADKLKLNINTNYKNDLKSFSLSLIDNRINDLENAIRSDVDE